jgi:hypothetical protein
MRTQQGRHPRTIARVAVQCPALRDTIAPVHHS